ncbi:MAG: hypothetical protein PHI02_06250 [Sulfurovaceae bacterium]|nr:hypothetical protein [Sulfurovaceae bacterium]
MDDEKNEKALKIDKSEKNSIAMRPCPFCECSNIKVMSEVVTSELVTGGKKYRTKYNMRCMQCKARGPIKDSETQARYAWEGKNPDTGWNTKNLFSGG